MKKRFYLPFFAMAALMVGCTNDDDHLIDGESGESEQNYLAINIVSNFSDGRASDPATFEDGDAGLYENKIEKIRFYFFKDNGQPAYVRKEANLTIDASNPAAGDGTSSVANGETHYNFVDWTNPTLSNDADASIENSTTAVIIINTQQGDKLPEKVVAIVNPEPNGVNSMTTTMLASRIMENEPRTDSKFTMSSSAYAYGGKAVFTTDVYDSFRKSVEEAKSNAAQIYVERVLAKVRVSESFNPNQSQTVKTITDASVTPSRTYNIYGALKEINGSDLHTVDKTDASAKIYIELLGWDLSSATDKSYLMKHINGSWTGLFSTATDADFWNNTSARRSYWAYNPTNVGYLYKTYNQHAASGKKDFTSANKKNIIYCEENGSSNTNAAPPISPTKVIVFGRLCDESGATLELVDWKGFRMLSTNLGAELLKDSYVQRLKKAVLNGSVTTYEPLAVDDFVFKTAEDVAKVTTVPSTTGVATLSGAPAATTEKRYNVYCQLKDNITGLQLDGAPVTGGVNAVNTELINHIGAIKYWKDGLTYFYANIQHLGATETAGEYGVIRNHVYDVNLKNISGIGTPIYDVDEVIIPERTIEENSYLATKVNVLAWRIVSKDYNLDW